MLSALIKSWIFNVSRFIEKISLGLYEKVLFKADSAEELELWENIFIYSIKPGLGINIKPPIINKNIVIKSLNIN